MDSSEVDSSKTAATARIRTPYLVVLLSLSVLLTVHYFRVAEYPRTERRLAIHAGMIDHTEPSQYRHRVLAPYLAEALGRSFALVLPGPQRFRPEQTGSLRALLLAYILINLVSFTVTLLGLYLLLRIWFSEHWALTGCLIAAATLPLTFHDALYHPWSQMEMALFTAGMYQIVRRQYGWFALTVLLASFNRETSIFLVLAFFFTAWPDRKELAISAGYFAIWIAIFLGLRIVLGFPPPTFTVRMAWEGNISPERWPYSMVLNLAIFGAFWIYIIRGFRLAPLVLRRAALMVPFYLVLLLVIGFWNEIRYWTAIYPILIPAGLFYMRHRVEGEPATAARGSDYNAREAERSFPSSGVR